MPTEFISGDAIAVVSTPSVLETHIRLTGGAAGKGGSYGSFLLLTQYCFGTAASASSTLGVVELLGREDVVSTIVSYGISSATLDTKAITKTFIAGDCIAQSDWSCSVSEETDISGTAASKAESGMYTEGEFADICGYVRPASTLVIDNTPAEWYILDCVPIVNVHQRYKIPQQTIEPNYYSPVSQRYLVKASILWSADTSWTPASYCYIRLVTTFSGQTYTRRIKKNSGDMRNFIQTFMFLVDFDANPDPTELAVLSVQYTGNNSVRIKHEASGMVFLAL